ncbi:hypothetical protein ACIBCD_26875 [Nocardia brasiliensis]|uniref:hypothetical protein n=1 Tax=Nocardia brasiliensis TaxID=37326 RepID=UPI0037AA0815
MAASTPRKSAPRKSPPRKVDAKKPAAPRAKTDDAEQAQTQRKIEAFDEFRSIAGDIGLDGRVTAPYVLDWIDPPVTARFPADLEDKIALDTASRHSDSIGILRVLLGDLGLLRVVQAFRGQPDGERLLVGLQMRLTDHFLGRGAAEVGGTAASSTS